MPALTQRGIGRPDYAQSIASAPVVQSLLPYKKAQTLSDMAELAARIGGPISIDRRGDVIWWDNFESGVGKWQSSSSFTSSGRIFRSGGLSGLFTPIGGGNSSSVDLILPQNNRSKTGFELSWIAVTSGDSVINNAMALVIENSESRGVALQADIRITIAHETVGGFSGVTVTTIELSTTTVYAYNRAIVVGTPVGMSGIPNFNTAKLVIDPVAKKYTRLIFAGVEYDLSSYDLIESTSPYSRAIYQMRVSNNAAAGTNMNTYIDDVIITINEPDND